MLKLTCEPDTKPLPFTVRKKSGPPPTALVGARLVTTGWVCGGKIVRKNVSEVPPPGTPFEGVVTETVAVPGVPIISLVMGILSSVGPSYCVGWGMPL
jgi:hypothetical protein